MSTPALQMKKAGAPLSSSVAKAKKKQMDEARKARLEKIRSKVRRIYSYAIDTCVHMIALCFLVSNIFFVFISMSRLRRLRCLVSNHSHQ